MRWASTITTPKVLCGGSRRREGCNKVAGGAKVYAGLQSIPDAYYQAAKIDQAAAGKCSALLNCQRRRVDDRDPALWTAL
jgi:hypothetical protein